MAAMQLELSVNRRMCAVTGTDRRALFMAAISAQWLSACAVFQYMVLGSHSCLWKLSWTYTMAAPEKAFPLYVDPSVHMVTQGMSWSVSGARG